MFATLLGIPSVKRLAAGFSDVFERMRQEVRERTRSSREGAPQRRYAKQNLILAANVGPRLQDSRCVQLMPFGDG